MESKEVFKYSFNLVFYSPPYFFPVGLPGQKFIYRTEEIQEPTTTEEIFKSCESFLNQTIEKYNHYKIIDEKPIKATYRLYIAFERDGLKKLEEKDLYDVTYNIEGEEKYIIEEKKYYKPPVTIKRNFFIFITSFVYIREEPPQYEPTLYGKKTYMIKYFV